MKNEQSAKKTIEENKIKEAKSLYAFYTKLPNNKLESRFYSLGKFGLLINRKGFTESCWKKLLQLNPRHKKARENLDKLKKD